MKLILRRNQKKGLVGNTIAFTLDARADVSEEEMSRINKYKMGNTILCEKRYELKDGGGLLSVIMRWWYRSREFSLTINDLVRGKHVECKDVVELLNMEKEITQSCEKFKQILEAATHFGGEYVIEL